MKIEESWKKRKVILKEKKRKKGKLGKKIKKYKKKCKINK
jgi:hypothetical protein